MKNVSRARPAPVPKSRAAAHARKGSKVPRAAEVPRGDRLFNQSVQKAFAVLGAFSAERRVQGLAEIAAAARLTSGSAQRCVHTLVQLDHLQRVARLHGWALTPKTLDIGYPYLAAHTVLEQATMHLADLNHATGESVSLSEPDGLEMVYIARFPSHKRFFIHMSVGRRLPMYCTGYAWANQECYLGDLTIGAPILGTGGVPVASVNLSGPTSRWTLEALRARLAPLLLESARAASGRVVSSHGA